MNADVPNTRGRERLFKMMCAIAKEMSDKTDCLTFKQSSVHVLDVCMAPGGFSRVALQANKGFAMVDAFTLPEEDGGHRVMIPPDKNIRICYADITMLAGEMGIDDIPTTHPEAPKFHLEWPFPRDLYDLVICDGQTLRTHQVADYRRMSEQTRLFNVELIIALQRIKPGGTIIVLLHRLHKYRTFQLLRSFDKFSEINLFKPTTFHADRSSFYLVAKNVRPLCAEASRTVQTCKESWMRCTFPDSDELPDDIRPGSDDTEDPEFLEKFLSIATPIWRVQETALREARWMK